MQTGLLSSMGCFPQGVVITFSPALASLARSLWHSLGWDVVPAMAVIAFLLLGIDEIGLQVGAWA